MVREGVDTASTYFSWPDCCTALLRSDATAMISLFSFIVVFFWGAQSDK